LNGLYAFERQNLIDRAMALAVAGAPE